MTAPELEKIRRIVAMDPLSYVELETDGSELEALRNAWFYMRQMYTEITGAS